MRKKILTPTIPILVFASLAGSFLELSPPAAKATTEAERSYWTFGELLVLEKEISAAAEASCGGDTNCEGSYFEQLVWDHYEDDLRYMLVNSFKNNHLQITSINPTAEKVSIYYRDKNYPSWEFGEGNEHVNLTGLYMAWADDLAFSNSSYYYPTADGKMGLQYVVDIDNGEMSEGTHKVFAHTTSSGDTSGWLKKGEESILDASGSGLSEDSNHRLYFSYYSDDDSTISGTIIYGDYSSEYEPGMEYRLVYDKAGLYAYWRPQWPSDDLPTVTLPEPAEPTEPTEPEAPSESIDPIDPNNSSDSVEQTGLIDQTNPVETENEKEAISTIISRVPEESASIANTESAIGTSTIRLLESSQEYIETVQNAPENTQETIDSNIAKTNDYVEVPLAANNSQDEHVFPWWIIVFGLSGIFLFLWWFIPVRRKKDDEE